MASVLTGNQVKLNNGQTVQAAQGGWYDGQQFWGGSLSNPGQINSQSNQQGAGQQVSKEVIAQTNPNNVAYIQQQQAQQQQQPDGGGGQMFSADGGGMGAAGGAGLGIAPPAAIDLPGLYKSLYDQSGAADLEKQIADKEQAAATTKAGINDNPWLSEGTRVGRVAKVDQLANDSINGLKNDLATKKADIQMKLDLQTKQFDINSQQAKAGLDQFNSLLASGALSGASGEDIANITKATGMSSSMIQSAIRATADKNRQTQTIQFDDGTNQGFAVIDQRTGQIISKQVIAGSKILGTAEDKAAYKSTGGSGKVTPGDNRAEALAQLPEDFKNKMTLGTAMSFYQKFNLKPQEIYNQYKAVNYYKPSPAQQKADQKRYNVK